MRNVLHCPEKRKLKLICIRFWPAAHTLGNYTSETERETERERERNRLCVFALLPVSIQYTLYHNLTT